MVTKCFLEQPYVTMPRKLGTDWRDVVEGLILQDPLKSYVGKDCFFFIFFFIELFFINFFIELILF